MKKEGEKKEQNLLFAYGRYFSIGLNLIAGMLICAGIGYYIDQKRPGGYFFTLIGIFLGLVYSGYELWKLIQELNTESKDFKER